MSGCQELITGCTILELKSGTLTKNKQCHFMYLSSMLSPFIFLMGLIIYVGLLLLTPKVLSLPPDPKDNAFLSWTPSYAAFHNQSNCWVCRACPSSPIESFPCSGPPFAWPGNHWDRIPQPRLFATNRIYWIYGSYLWAWLPPSLDKEMAS